LQPEQHWSHFAGERQSSTATNIRHVSEHHAQRAWRPSFTASVSLGKLPHSNNDRVANHGVHDFLSPAPLIRGTTRASIQASKWRAAWHSRAFWHNWRG
jgi:hypothetical protein